MAKAPNTTPARKVHSADGIKRLRVAGIERGISPELTQKRREAYAKRFGRRLKAAVWTIDPDFDEGL